MGNLIKVFKMVRRKAGFSFSEKHSLCRCYKKLYLQSLKISACFFALTGILNLKKSFLCVIM